MNKIIFNPLTIIAFTLLSITILIALQQNTNKIGQSQQNIGILEQETSKLASEISSIEAKLTEAEQTLSKEKILRNELLMQKEGEYIVQMPDVEPGIKAETPTVTLTPWEEWKKLIF